MIDILLLVGLLVSMGSFIHIHRQSLKVELDKSDTRNTNWYPLIVISKRQLRQAGIQINKILLSLYCFKVAATFSAFTLIELSEYQLSSTITLMLCFICFFAPEGWFLIRKNQRKTLINNSL